MPGHRPLKSIITGGLVTLLAACASSSNRPTAYTDPQPEIDVPAMWRLADSDSEIYLFGTFHLLPKGVAWRSDLFAEAMADTPITYFEADAFSPTGQARIVELIQLQGLNPPGVTLSGLLGPSRSQNLERVLGQFGVPLAAMENVRPWLVLVTLSQFALQAGGFDAASGADQAIEAKAKDEGDDIRFLESIERQILALASLDGPALLNNFDQELERFETFADHTGAGVDAWRRGDLPALDQLILAPARTEAPAAYKSIFIDRNAEWAEQIEDMMAGSGKVFIAVGAGHLIGDGSVIEMLQAKGFKPMRVQ